MAQRKRIGPTNPDVRGSKPRTARGTHKPFFATNLLQANELSFTITTQCFA